MRMYRKLPILVEAEPYRAGLEDGYKVYCTEYPNEGHCYLLKADYEGYEKENIEDNGEDAKPVHTIICPAIFTLEGWHDITPTDYIITGVEGKRYPCKKDIFEKTYEVLEMGHITDAELDAFGNFTKAEKEIIKEQYSKHEKDFFKNPRCALY